MKTKLIFLLNLLMFSIITNAQYTLTDDDVVVNNGVLKSYRNETQKNIIIPEVLDGQTVTSIGSQSFMGRQLTNISIPNTVVSIGDFAFYLNKLTSVVIPNSVISIGEYAFYLNNINSIDIPNSIISIGKGTFGYNLISSLFIPNSVTHICEEAFTWNSLQNITIPNSVVHIGKLAFASNVLLNITIPSSVTFIGENAFADNALNNFILPIASKEGYVFNYWNEDIVGDTKVTNLAISYIANFTESLNENVWKNDNTIKVFPNPTSGNITIKGESIYKLVFINSFGKIVKVIDSNIEINVTANIKGLSTGVYFIKIYSDKGISTKQIILK